MAQRETLLEAARRISFQLLIAFLHRESPLDDSRLTIEWERVADGVGALRERATSSPLSLFYTSLKRKLEPVLARPDGGI